MCFANILALMLWEYLNLTGRILGSTLEIQGLSYNEGAGNEQTKDTDKYSLFKNFCETGLAHLGIRSSHDIDFQDAWKEAEPFSVCKF